MRNFIIFLLIVVIFTFVYFINIGKFCNCSDIYCPSDDLDLKPVLSYN